MTDKKTLTELWRDGREERQRNRSKLTSSDVVVRVIAMLTGLWLAYKLLSLL